MGEVVSGIVNERTEGSEALCMCISERMVGDLIRRTDQPPEVDECGYAPR